MAIVRRAPSLSMAAAVAGLLGNLACNQLLGLDDWHARVGDAGVTPGEGGGGPACTSNAHCIDPAKGGVAFCVTGKCADLDEELCLPQVWPTSIDLGKDNVALIAAFIPVNGGTTAGNALAFILALEELAAAGGIPGEKRRQLAMIFCASEDDRVQQAMQHVAEDLHVPAVIAGFDELGLIHWIENHAVKRKIFTLNPGAATDALKFKEVDQLLWNLLGTPEDVAFAYRPLLLRTEKYVRNGRLPSALPDAPVKVALLATDTATEQSVAEVLRNGPLTHTTDGSPPRDLDKALVFNGRSTAENGENFLFIEVNALERGENPKYADINDQLTAFRPDVVIGLTREEIVQIVTNYEGPNSGIDPAARPIWLLSYRNAHPQGLLDYFWTDFKQKRERFLGVQYGGASDPTQREAWLARMKDRYYPDVKESSYSAVENFYDAVYWLAYGLAAAGRDAPTTGESIRDGVRTLLAGPPIYAGPKDTIHEAFSFIGDFTDTTYVGALGPPDISKKFGTWNSVGGVYCYVQNDDGSIAPRYDVLRYNGSNGELDGLLDCFPTNGTF